MNKMDYLKQSEILNQKRKGLRNEETYLWKRVLVPSSRQLCHCGTDTCSLLREERAHGYYIYISHVT